MADPIETPSNRKHLWLLAIIAGLLAAYFFAWRAGAREMEKTVVQWIADQRAMGVEISHDGISSTGFPLRLRTKIDQPAISAPGAGRWSADQLNIDLAPYNLTRVTFTPLGAQNFSAAGFGEWTAGAGFIRADLEADKAKGWLLSIAIEAAHAKRLSGDGDISIERLNLDLSPAADDQTALVLALAIVSLDIREAESELNITDFQTELSLTKTDMLSGPDAAAQWRAAGGALLINSLAAEAETTKLSLSGELTVDNADYPAGLLDAEIVNPAGLSAWLGEAGVISAAESETAAATLSLMAIAGGGKIDAPIELKNGAAQIAGVKLADLPPVN